MARTPKQAAASRRNGAKNRGKRGGNAITEIKSYNQNGPLKDPLTGKRLAEGIASKHPIISRPQSGVKKPKLKPKGIGAHLQGNPQMGDYGWRN